jgi:hypothetical protein
VGGEGERHQQGGRQQACQGAAGEAIQERWYPQAQGQGQGHQGQVSEAALQDGRKEERR